MSMINLRCRTEYSFRQASGSVDDVLAATEGPVGICDRSGTWGHVQFAAACKKAGRKAILGVEILTVNNMKEREKQGANGMAFLAKSNKGLREIYELVSIATAKENFYYFPRIDYGLIYDLSDEVIVLSGPHPNWGSLPRLKNVFVELSPTSSGMAREFAAAKGYQTVATSDNLFPRPDDRVVYEVVAGRDRALRTSAMHLLTEAEWKICFPGCPEALRNAEEIAVMCEASLPIATIVESTELRSLRQLCEEGARSRGLDLTSPEYAARLERELGLIHEKEFEAYFYLVWDLVRFARTKMLVGPARGSSCGSLVCYLLYITEIDPLPYSLLFERFIDINRKDLPDIDIDFPDDRRELVFDYLRDKYGHENVARLGTIMRYKAKSAIDLTAKELQVPAWEVNQLKNSIIERSSGDSRAGFCIMDTFAELDIGKAVAAKYPQMLLSGRIEGHASGSGQHAAGIVVTSVPVRHFCSVNSQTNSVQVDKRDAEKLNLLKIDALGLRTLSVLQDCLDEIGWSREQLLGLKPDDQEAFDVLNSRRFAGIFQFEGGALQSLCSQFRIERFEDLASMTALARPGPLHSGGATEFIRRRNGEHQAVALHPSIAHTTDVTYGVVIYQEQVMQVAREMGKLSWEDVSSLRKAMSKSLGKEFFDQYWFRFRDGAMSQSITEDEALNVWNQINTMGSWSFNRSHAVAYAMVSYWCLVLKAHYPLEFGAACLRNARSEEQSIQLLRELVKEGYSYKPFDLELSKKNWSVQNGTLIGGLTSIKGIGDKTADDILRKRANGVQLPVGQRTKLANAKTPFDCIFECQDRWGHIKADPAAHNIKSKLLDLDAVQPDEDAEVPVCFIAKIIGKDLRDLNDPTHVKKRNGKMISGNSLMVLFTVEDDTTQLPCMIDRHNYLKLGKPIIEEGSLGEWYIFKGHVKKGFRQAIISNWRKLSGTSHERTAP